jgi:hypothetical protein
VEQGSQGDAHHVEVCVKVFLSSVISGMEDYRAIARRAAETLGHTVLAAENFRASPLSPQQVCLGAVRDADVVVLLLGARYGAPQGSGLSPTHEEYREARDKKPVLAFVQSGVAREREQQAFVDEVSTWEGGGYRETFDSPESLAAAVTRGLHNWELAQQAGPVNEAELVARTTSLLPTRSVHAAGVPCCTSSCVEHPHSSCSAPQPSKIRDCTETCSAKLSTEITSSLIRSRGCRPLPSAERRS